VSERKVREKFRALSDKLRTIAGGTLKWRSSFCDRFRLDGFRAVRDALRNRIVIFIIAHAALLGGALTLLHQ